jgi:hypothetical protein
MALPTATAYLSSADADTYFATSFNNATWTALSAADKSIALAEATRYLEGLCWHGEKCSDTQPLQWPRKIDKTSCCAAVACTALPSQLVQATAELALALNQNKAAIIGGGGSSQRIKSASLGSMSVTYADGATTTKVSSTAPLVLQKFPWLVDVLGPCLMKTSAGGARVLHRECVSTYNGRFY